MSHPETRDDCPGRDTEAPTFPAADLDRRFYAFAIDRLIAWPLIVAVVACAAYRFLFSDGPGRRRRSRSSSARVLLVGLAFAVVLGHDRSSPGKALLGLRVVAPRHRYADRGAARRCSRP